MTIGQAKAKPYWFAICLTDIKFCLVMESLQVWSNQKKPLRGFVPSLKEKYFFP